MRIQVKIEIESPICIEIGSMSKRETRIGLAKGRKLLRHAFWVLPTTRQMDPLAKV